MRSALLFFLLSLSVVSSASAGAPATVGNPIKEGGWSSGGGGGVVCFDPKDGKAALDSIHQAGILPDSLLDKIISIETLDLYQAKHPDIALSITSQAVSSPDGTESEVYYTVRTEKVPGFRGNPNPPVLQAESESEAIDHYAHRLFAPVSSEVPQLKEFYDAGEKELAYIGDRAGVVYPIMYDLIDGFKIFPKANIEVFVYDIPRFGDGSCFLVPLARNYFEVDGGKRWSTLQLDERLYYHPKNSRLSQIVLMLHEYLYYGARALLGQKTSQSIRTLIGALLNQERHRGTGEISALVKRLGLDGASHTDARSDTRQVGSRGAEE